VGTVMWPHGRWRLVLTGEANHAGTTRLRDRRDPLVVAGYAVVAARARAVREGMMATVSRLVVEPNAPNSVPGRVTATLDARAPGGDQRHCRRDRPWITQVTILFLSKTSVCSYIAHTPVGDGMRMDRGGRRGGNTELRLRVCASDEMPTLDGKGNREDN